MMKVLVACEESQKVTKCFRELGADAYSCDVLPTSGSNPEWHIQGDVLDVLRDGWDAMIAFPPCTHLARSGARWWKQKQEDGRQRLAIDFFMELANAPVKHIAIENPVGIMSSIWRPPDQIIHPYQFGNGVKKQTCLWLKNLPLLIPTDIVKVEDDVVLSSGKRMSKWYYDLSKHKATRSKLRSVTFDGIARAMAEQWYEVILDESNHEMD